MVMPSDATRQHERSYEEAARICTKMRKSEGNCTIYRIDINANEKGGSDAVLLDGSAWLSFLQRVSS